MKEIIIYPNPENSNHEKGLFFEELIKNIFKSQRYKVKERINFTGMEIDLLCQHLDKDEVAFVECKAREELSSGDISKFSFDVYLKKFDYGFFLYTKYYQHQAGGMIEEIKNDDRFKNLYFWDCEKIIELLVHNKNIMAFNLNFDKYRVTKTILLYCYISVFYIVLLSDSTVPKYYCVYDAQTLEPINNKDTLTKILKMVKDINGLTFFEENSKKSNITTTNPSINVLDIDVVAEIQESESWDDYKPASTKYFVGRKALKEQIFTFLDRVSKRETKSRVFYIEGKSGWGKSSLVNELRGRCRNKYYKNKYYVFAVDSRSLNSSSFVALSFKKMIEDAVKQNFIDYDPKKLVISSNYDILTSDSTKEILSYLEEKQKLLIIVFDQFEDIFRKGDLFKIFYKFLLDVRNVSSNIVVGFSWKSEINIPIGHEAYYLWQQSREYSHRFDIIEFDFSESNGIIKQLEKAINQKLDKEFIRKIADNSQGFPWLVRKLCVHIAKQINNNVSVSTLYEQDFNVESLFKEDQEGLTPDEGRALNYIAKRSYEENAFDVTEVDDVISSSVIDSLLLHKKLIIKSGSKYNIYWDIFRDYLVTNEIPKIGENYLIRQTVQPVLDIYLLFKESKSLKLDDICNSFPSKEGTILNSLRLLRDIGLIKFENETYQLRRTDIGASEEDFKKYLYDKLQKHTLYLEIQKREGEKLELSDLSEMIRVKFKGREFSEDTLKIYAQDFIHWLKFAGIEIPHISNTLHMEAQNFATFTPQTKPSDSIGYFEGLVDKQSFDFNFKTSKILNDLKSIGLLIWSKNTIYLTPVGKNLLHNKEKDFYKNICLEALKTEKLKKAYEVICNNPNIKLQEFKCEIQDLLSGIKSKEYYKRTNGILYKWGKFLYEHLK